MSADKQTQKIEVSSPLEPQPQVEYQYQKMHRGDSMYEPSLVEFGAISHEDSKKRSFIPKPYAKHVGIDGQTKRKSTINKKRPVFNSAKARIENNSSLSNDEKKRALLANEKASSERALKRKIGATIKGKAENSKWRMDSKELRDAIRSIRLKKKLNKGKTYKRVRRPRTRSQTRVCYE
mmetsp:Transcript_20811/g.45187  ORF Transcript_20811/g.45187 Transcript_20811/m.45187 type:complete len:179 (-) Transcript_20811:47-583(-)